MGLELLDRSSGRARLTPTGLAVSQWSDRILDGVRSLVAGAAALRSEGRTQLRIAASMTVAEYLVPLWLDRLRSTEPDLGISLQMGNSAQVAEMVKRRRVEMGFIEGRSTFPELRSRDIGPDNLVVVVAPSHPWARRRQPLSASMLAATPLVLREVGSGTREVLEIALAKHGLSIIPLVELGSTTAIKAAIASGEGAAVLSHLATEADVESGHLIQVPVKGLALGRSIRAVWARDNQLSSVAKRFLSQVKT